MPLISKKSRYALHGLAFMAAFQQEDPVPFHKIHEYLTSYSGRLSLSPGYIAKVFQDVSRAGFTLAVSGPRGGYHLARPPQQITLIEIVEALDGPLLTACCLLSVGNCNRSGLCGVAGIIHQAEEAFHHFFQKQTLASLARKMSFPDPAPLKVKRRAGTRR